MSAQRPGFSQEELSVWSGGTWVPGPPVRVMGVSNDTRSIREGNLYFALSGERFDGHEFAAQAMSKGAAGAVVAADRVDGIRKQCAAAASWPLLAVGDTRRALMDIAAGYRKSVGLEIVGITGSVGKSTVKEMTAAILGRTRRTACTKGNWNNDVGLPLSILAMDRSAEIGVYELGTNHPGEIPGLCEVLCPSSGAVTNVGPVHLEYFGSIEAIAAEKGALLQCIPGDGFAVLDSGGAFFELLSSMCRARVIAVGCGRDRDDYARVDGDPATGEFTVLENATGERVSLRTPLPGEHNITNAMFALAVARAYGIPWGEVREALANYVPLPMRWERLRVTWRKKGDSRRTGPAPAVGVINDAYNANPLSMRASISTFAGYEASGLKWLVLSDMLELGPGGEAEHEAVGAFAAEVIGRQPDDWGGLIAVGPQSHAIARGAGAAGLPEGKTVWCSDTDAAYEALSDRISSGDELLLKGSRGMRLEELVEGMEVQR